MAAIETVENVVPFRREIDLLAEANHRIANHLALLAGMVQIQASAVAKGPETLTRAEVRGMLQEAAGRIIGVGNLHRRFSRQAPEGVLDLNSHLIECAQHVVAELGLDRKVYITQRLERGCMITADHAQTLVLVVGEIVMNAAKHAHPAGLATCISIACSKNIDGSTVVEIADDGVGLPENFDAEKDGGMGLKLIRSLVQKLDARLAIESDSLGLSFRIRLPAPRN